MIYTERETVYSVTKGLFQVIKDVSSGADSAAVHWIRGRDIESEWVCIVRGYNTK